MPCSQGRTVRALRTIITGQVQGLGFRPYVYRIAIALGVNGTVSNTRRGLLILAQGRNARRLLNQVTTHPPPLAHLAAVKTRGVLIRPIQGFTITHSATTGRPAVHVLPDLATCPHCRSEITDPTDRRYTYPFTNCTQCGPRYTIIEHLPYDRPNTTMRAFTMCPHCAREYSDPADRRYHAQPNACPNCGPTLQLINRTGTTLATGHNALLQAATHLLHGRILALKSIGGYQLACDATNTRAVATLRRRKNRPRKPLALMAATTAVIARFCRLGRNSRTLLQSPAAPILLLPKRPRPRPELPDSIAPGNSRLGLMLPYSPLHLTLLNQLRHQTGREPILVITSANQPDQPIAGDQATLRRQLSGVYDLQLTHDRPIANPCDDSVLLPSTHSSTTTIRRARGYAPQPTTLPPILHLTRPVLAVGAESKNCFCLASQDKAYLSPHIGSLASAQGQTYWLQTLDRYRTWTGIRPELIACDLHPDYLSTRLAEKLSRQFRAPLVRVQHHYAHTISALAEHGADGPVLGLACDGAGLGTDGAIWGCEFLLVQPDRSWTRVGHID